MTYSLLIVEDHEVVRQTLFDWLSIQFKHCLISEAASGEESVALVRAESPQIVIMDISLPNMSGIEAIRQIKAISPQVQVIVLSIHEASEYEADASLAGASFYVSKRQMHRELIPLIERLLPKAI